MKPIARKPVLCLVAVCFLFLTAAPPCGAEEGAMGAGEPYVAMIGDALVIRPLGIAAMIVGAAVFVVSLPFSALAGNTREAAQKLVVEPTNYTFQRPLGEI